MTSAQRERFIPFNIGVAQYYIDKITNNTLSYSAYELMTTANYEKDKKRGYEDRMVGYYDKWYRYNRLDEGEAYDDGVKEAIKDPACVEALVIIESIFKH